ncbi:hypothetical protein CWO91_34835 [Bradyrhizobium genosp. SA-3]|nr:hypothetical protein CWO91_34835 [Bradyrhizobium genosp. SA-3]
MHLLSPLLFKVAPEAALKLVAELRTLPVSLPGASADAPLIMMTEEYLHRLADQIEKKLRPDERKPVT